MAFIDVAKNMGFDGCCSSVAWALTALRIAEVHSLNLDTSRSIRRQAANMVKLW